jgi:hypothetical protein
MDTVLALKTPIGSAQELYRNYAEDDRLAPKVLKDIQDMMKRARGNRQKTDRLAYRRYNQWALVTDDQYYKGRSNTYIPAVRRGVEKLVTAWLRVTFPNDRWWGVEATAPEYEKNLDGIRTLLNIQLKTRMKFKRKMRPAYRQLALYGTSPIRVAWKCQQRTSVEAVPGAGGQGVRMQKVTRTIYDDPDLQAVDYFSWGVYPETVADPEDARLVYEDFIEELDVLKADKANYGNLAKVKALGGSGSTGNEAMQFLQQRLAQLGITESELHDANFMFGTRYYLDVDFKDGAGPVPAEAIVAWNQVVTTLHRNPYERPPYFCMKDAELPNEFLGHSRTEATDRMQISLNDHSNQDMDASSFANNPVLVIDPNYAEDVNAIALYPSAKILAPPEAVKFDRPPEAAYSQKEKVSFLYSLILENLGATSAASASPAAKGQARGARTFGGMQMMQGMADMDAKEVVEFQQDNVFEPMLGYLAWLNANFLSDDRTLRTAGAKGAAVVVTRETFKGDYAYTWLGTTTMMNQTMLSAGMLVFLNVVKGIPQQPGFRIGIPHILRSWWEYQGLPGADQVVIEDSRQASVDPHLENELVSLGRAIAVSATDNDAEHMSVHSLAAAQLPPGDARRNILLQHVATHQHAGVMKQQAQLMHQAQLEAQQEQQLHPMPPTKVVLQGKVPPPDVSRIMGDSGGAPGSPPGARAGRSMRVAPPSGTGPARAIAGAPVGAGT